MEYFKCVTCGNKFEDSYSINGEEKCIECVWKIK